MHEQCCYSSVATVKIVSCIVHPCDVTVYALKKKRKKEKDKRRRLFRNVVSKPTLRFWSALERVPTVALNEGLVVSLCSMYELAYVNHSDIKRTLNNWIARVAPNEFDSSCTRI